MTAKSLDEEAIFKIAAGIPSEAIRCEYLQQVCGGDDALLERVQALLHARDEAPDFLEHAPPGIGVTVISSPVTEEPGDIIGPYKLLEQIGEGGFGVVFMGEQAAPVKRKVALKVIKPGMDTRQVIARFEAERQALALMDHPNIARVLDAGATDTGRPFFVMELVKGIPITDYCDEHQLAPKERLELFVTVCHAVQHAHQKGIIHRDIKPSNVLVTRHDDKPVVKVIDFGIAKATSGQLTDKTLFTGFAQLVGTPLYMSPEQASMNAVDVDTRSDIYSLGVLLYELLTGTTPFDRTRLQQAAFDEVRRIIREEEPQKPSTRISSLGDTLPSVSAQRKMEPRKLSQLVQGDLDWIVMKALEKDRTRRYETANGFAADVLRYLADEPVSACPPSATYRLRKFARRNKRTLLTAALLGAMLLVVAGSFGWIARDQAAQRGRNAEAVSALLDRCEDALRADQADQAALALEAAERRETDGGAEELAARLAQCQADLRLLGELNEITTFSWTMGGRDRAFPGEEATAAKWPDPLASYGVTAHPERTAVAAARVNTSLIRDRLLTALDHWLAWDPSAEVRAGVRAVLQAADPDPYRDAFRDALVSRDGQAQNALAGRPEALAQPARFAVIFGQLPNVPKDRQRAVLVGALRDRPGDVAVLMQLGRSYEGDDRPEAHDESVRWFQAAVAAHPGGAMARNNLGVALLHRGDVSGAVACFEEVVRIDPTFALGHSNLGAGLIEMGDPEGAVRCFREAVRLNPDDDVNQNNLGIALFRSDPDGAIQAYRKAIQIEPDYFGTHIDLGLLLCNVKRDYDGAIHAFEEAIRIEPLDPRAHYNLGIALSRKGDPDGAIGAFRKAIEINGDSFDAHLELGGILCDEKQDYDGAIHAFEEAIRIDPQNALAQFNLGNALRGKGDIAGTIAAYRKAIKIDPNYARAYVNLGATLKDEGDQAERIAAYRNAVRLRPDLAIARANLGVALLDEGDVDGAIMELQQAHEIDPNNVITHVNLAIALRRKGAWGAAIDELRTLIRLNPQDALVASHLAWLLAACPDDKSRDPAQAIELATMATQLAPDQASGWRALGAARYRTDDWRAALTSLERAIELQGGGDSYDWFFVAMAHAKLGEQEQARASYNRGVEWMDENQPDVDELLRFRAEAAELLKVADDRLNPANSQ